MLGRHLISALISVALLAPAARAQGASPLRELLERVASHPGQDDRDLVIEAVSHDAVEAAFQARPATLGAQD